MTDKVTRQVVRSFGNVHPEIIKFNTPLTLIVGYNGSGKTTIIECLKYATTGELPPNSKQGAFIHDPKLCGEKEVLAQVKLGFTNTAQQSMIVTRSMQLTVQKAARKFKTLECSLVLTTDGERHCLSSRVAELDTMLPTYTGVSVAILDSVIFCHQDESLWPMSEPTALKKKFDEIFEAMKYTKAIENLKTLRKVKNGQLPELRAIETAAKDTKDKAARVKVLMLKIQDEIESLRKRKEDLTQRMDDAQAEAKHKHEQARGAVGLVQELSFKKERATMVQDDIERIRSTLNESQESDEWLHDTLAQYEQHMVEYQTEAQEHTSQLEKLQQDTESLRMQMNVKQGEKGRYVAEQARYQSQIKARVQLVKKTVHRHGMRGYDGELDEQNIRDFIDKMHKHAREKDKELERVQSANDEDVVESQAKLTEIENRRSTRTTDKVTAKQALALNDRKAKNLQHEVDQVSVDEGATSVLKQSRDAVQLRLENAGSEYEKNDWDIRLRSENTALHEAEAEADVLRDELAQVSRLAKDRASLELVKSKMAELQRSIDTLSSAHGDKLISMLGSGWSIANVERDFQAVLDTRSRALEEAKKQQDGVSRELSQLDFKLKEAQTNLKQKKATMTKCHDRVLQSIVDEEDKPLASIDDYEESFEKLQEDFNSLQAEGEAKTYVSNYYNVCLRTANKGHCQLCERPFSDKKEQSSAMAKIQKKLQEAISEDYKVAVEDLRAVVKTAIAARTDYDTYKSLKHSELPALETSIDELRNAKDEIIARLEDLDKIVAEADEARTEANSLNTIVTSLARSRKDVAGYEAELSRIASQQKVSGGARSVEEINSRSTDVHAHIRLTKAKIAKLVSDRDSAKGIIGALELESINISRSMDKASHELDKRQGLLSQIDEIRNNSAQLRETVGAANDDLEQIGPQLAKAKAQHDELLERGKAKIKSIQAEKEKLTESVHEFKLVEDDINNYLQRDGPGQLAACERAIKDMDKQRGNNERIAKEIGVKVQTIQQRLTDGERTKRNIEDNINFRGNVERLKGLQNEILDLESRKVTDTWERLAKEAKQADELYQQLLAQRGPIVGQMSSKDTELCRYMEEWNADYQSAGKKFREAHIKLETTKAAVEDLGKCMQAVDAAIMKYHSAKMEEINRVAGELWQSTYQGTDLDTIMIRSEAEDLNKKRGYNYRVVMVKQDAEMDMRGRCSAGQKVLACIIIRLALAECFGVNCGIIALDEPTTNLDSDNIRALADSLHRIIKQRRQQANFQIIIITHDEDFLKTMRCQEFCDTYYRVSRNDKQKSIIEKQSIEEVLGS